MKMKYLKKEWVQRLLLILIPLSIILFLIISFEVYGSKVDWVSQHVAFPDYFRKLFYETGSLFPEFSMNLGAGQICTVHILWCNETRCIAFLFFTKYFYGILYSLFFHNICAFIRSIIL